MAPFTTPTEPRCPSCGGMLMQAGAICVACDEQRHYESPNRTSPPFEFSIGATDPYADPETTGLRSATRRRAS